MNTPIKTLAHPTRDEYIHLQTTPSNEHFKNKKNKQKKKPILQKLPTQNDDKEKLNSMQTKTDPSGSPFITTYLLTIRK